MGISLGKLLILAAVIVAIVYGVKLLRRRQELKEERERPSKVRSESSAQAPAAEAEEMVACARCGEYVAKRGAKGCGRASCPFG
ncbi:MAG: hypothetical protein JNK11_12715 [Alphaproteobacteria bacterium]|nr:hypothetical protein [Alphaproteobacteria bacterium]